MKKVLLAAMVVAMASTAAAFSFESFFGGLQPSGEVGIVQVSGNIVPEASGFSTGVTPEDIRELNQEAINQDVDAVIYEVNSGGGAVVASKDIQRNIEAMDVPTVCRLRDTGASGAYLFSLGCDRIVADSATITGSIGVTSSYIEFSDLMDEIGVSYVNVTSGDRKEAGSPFKEPTEEEVELLKEKSEMIGEEFRDEVQQSRNLSDQQIDEAGTGEIFLGQEAKELDLVDSLGGRSAAIEEAENLTGTDLEPVKVETAPEFGFIDFLLPSLDVESTPVLRAVA